jgi:uncharacterized membrane protein (DUF4010 family)
MIFEVLCIVHVLVWVFVLTAFVNKDMAYYNVYFVIPFIYIVHILPFHILITLKKKFDPENYKIHEEEFYNTLVIPKLFRNVTSKLEKLCFASPLSTQGMLIFGLLTSIFVLHPPDYLLCNAK